MSRFFPISFLQCPRNVVHFMIQHESLTLRRSSDICSTASGTRRISKRIRGRGSVGWASWLLQPIPLEWCRAMAERLAIAVMRSGQWTPIGFVVDIPVTPSSQNVTMVLLNPPQSARGYVVVSKQGRRNTGDARIDDSLANRRGAASERRLVDRSTDPTRG
jgi:hypothetical protein